MPFEIACKGAFGKASTADKFTCFAKSVLQIMLPALGQIKSVLTDCLPAISTLEIGDIFFEWSHRMNGAMYLAQDHHAQSYQDLLPYGR